MTSSTSNVAAAGGGATGGADADTTVVGADPEAQEEAHEQSAALAAAILRPESPENAAEDSFAGVGGRPHSHGGPTGAAARPIPDTDRGGRLTSYDVADFPVPTGREEDWRFTPLDRLRGLHEVLSPGPGGAAGRPGGEGKGIVEVARAPEVRLETVGREDPRRGIAGVPGDRVAAQAWSGVERTVVLTAPRETVASTPTVVSVRGEGAEGTAFGHLVVDVEPFASAVVVVDYSGSATYADNLELRVGDGANLTLVAVHGWAEDAVHLSQHSARLGRDARLKHVAVTLGGSVVRVAPYVDFSGPGGDVELLGLYFADAGQHLEHRLFVDHAVPHCRSNVVYKGALQGEGAHTVWVGDVLIRARAEGTDTYELNRNLVLTDGARADSVPNLEIETGEITGAGHASATGRFDDEQLFYLQARGIPEVEARRLVVRGFFADLVHQIGLPELEERLMAEIEAELQESVL